MAFDWKRFFDQNRIEFVTRGSNVGRNQVNIKCPFCGESDPSHHMGVDLAGRGWGCWRNKQHRGKSRARLIQALLHCSLEQAHRLAGTDRPAPPPVESIMSIVAGHLGMDKPVDTTRQRLQFPSEFKPMYGETAELERLADPFWDYLEDRGYDWGTARFLAKTYELHWAIRGPYKYRIIFPIYDDEHRLKTWSGRAINDDAVVRYKTLPGSQSDRADPGLPLALAPPSALLLGLPVLWAVRDPRLLVICEGPFDALRITALGWQRGVYGTCLFGLNLTGKQVHLLSELATRFPKMALLLDNDAAMQAFSILREMAGTPCILARTPDGVKDPGDLSMKRGAALIGELLAA